MSEERVLSRKPGFESPGGPTEASIAQGEAPRTLPHEARTEDALANAAEAEALGEDVELSLDLRRQLLLVDNRDLDHYTLLGIEPTADKKAIKRAYFELAAKFHPDKHFRKKLGSYKLRLETFFSRLTIAQEILSTKASREEYDAYLEVQRRSRRIEQLLAEATEEAQHAEANVEREVRAQEAPLASSRAVAAPASAPPSVNAQARRDAFARRLLGGRTPGASSIPPPPSTQMPAATLTAADAIGALRRRYEERVALAKAAEAGKCAARGEKALAAGEVIKAANLFRIASGLAPGDAELERKWQESQTKAETLLAETYSRQAEYEEKSSNWAAAARSWARVCQARPSDANVHGRAAEALMKAGGDLRQAARLAQRVCELQPSAAGARLLLAEVYLAADLTHNARREIETAAKLGAPDGIIAGMLKRLGPPT